MMEWVELYSDFYHEEDLHGSLSRRYDAYLEIAREIDVELCRICEDLAISGERNIFGIALCKYHYSLASSRLTSLLKENRRLCPRDVLKWLLRPKSLAWTLGRE